jgi:membrane fusion protein, macrolide-specific efflux system
MRRTLLSFFTLVAMAVLLLTTACSGGNSAAKEEATPTPLPTPATATKPTYTVKRGDILAKVQFSARVMPAVQDELFFRASGRVRKVYARGGDIVTKGQILADLISLDQMESQARSQELALRRAEINVEQAWLRQQLAATEMPNWDSGYDIKMKLNSYELELAQIAYEETKLNSQNLDTAISDARITSTLDGKVLNINVLEGQEVNAFQGLITVGDDTKLEVGATLTSTQMQDLGEGMVAQVELPNRPGEKLAGKVRSLPYPYGTSGGTNQSQTATKTGATVDTTTRVSLDDPNAMEGFKLGDLVQVTVIKESKQGVLWVPPAAIRTFEGRNFVVVKTDGLPRRVDVKIGIKNDEAVEITDGVEEGAVVIAP